MTSDQTTADRIRWISDTVTASYPADTDRETILWRRVTKVAEESGEAVAALGGYVGENPRKGMTHTRDDLVDELLDVALAALGAVEHVMGDGGPYALDLLDKHVRHVATRLEAFATPSRTRREHAAEVVAVSVIATGDDDDPNTWPQRQRRVLRYVRDHGGWYASWDRGIDARVRGAVSSRARVRWQREHLLHESPWYCPARPEDRDRLLALAAMLTDPADLNPVR